MTTRVQFPTWLPTAAACLSALFALSAQAEVVPPSDVQTLDSYVVNNKYFAPGNPAMYEFGGVNVLSIANRPGTFVELCLEFFVPGADVPRTLSDGWGSSALAGSQQATAQALLSHTVGTFNTMRDAFNASGGWGNAANGDAGERLAGFSGAMQTALWEIIMDTGLSSSNGVFGLYHGVFAAGTQGSYATQYADEFLGHLADGSWTDQGGMTYTFADSGDNQDHILVQLADNKVPEPASALLVGMGLLAIRSARRQRKVASHT